MSPRYNCGYLKSDLLYYFYVYIFTQRVSLNLPVLSWHLKRYRILFNDFCFARTLLKMQFYNALSCISCAQFRKKKKKKTKASRCVWLDPAKYRAKKAAAFSSSRGETSFVVEAAIALSRIRRTRWLIIRIGSVHFHWPPWSEREREKSDRRAYPAVGVI